MTAWWARAALSAPGVSQSWHVQAEPFLRGLLPVEPGGVLLRPTGKPLPGVDRERPATPGDQRDTDPQCGPVEQAHPADQALRLLAGRLGWMIVATECGRQRCVHDGVSSYYSCGGVDGR